MKRIYAATGVLFLGVILIFFSYAKDAPNSQIFDSVISQMGITLIISGFIYFAYQQVFEKENQTFFSSLLSKLEDSTSENLDNTKEDFNQSITKINEAIRSSAERMASEKRRQKDQEDYCASRYS